MHTVRNPVLHSVDIRELRPTQMTVGMREVDVKRRRWRDKSHTEGAEYLGQHMVPVVIGPKERYYLLDHHHLCRALLEERVESVLVTAVAHLNRLAKDEFWVFLDNRGWLHPFDSQGIRRSADELPKSVAQLRDDPFRSLAGELRRVGGFAKDTTPFSEFLWADFLRRRIKDKLVTSDFSAALEKALGLSKSKDSSHLPGWCGALDEVQN